MSKSSPLLIFKNHLKSLRNTRTDTRSLSDIIQAYAVPAVIGILVGVLTTSVDLNHMIVPVVLIGGVMAMSVFHSFDNGMKLRRDAIASQDSHAITLVDELNANSLYAVTVSIILSVFLMLIGLFTFSGIVATIINALAVAAVVHLVLTALMVLKRTGAMYRAMFP